MQPFNEPKDLSPNYSGIDPFDNRYFDEQTSYHLSEYARIRYQAYMEAALAHTLAKHDICSQEIANQIEDAARKVTPEEVYEAEKTTKHDIKALVNTIKSKLPDEAKPYVHFGATSYDIIANAQVLQIRESVQQSVLPLLKNLIQTLSNLADKYAETPQIGRTHGQHGVPITFGFTIAQYVSRLGNSYFALTELSKALKGKFSGATGSYNSLSIFVEDPLQFESDVLAAVALEPSEASTQIAPAENLIRLIDELTITAGILSNIGHDMRHLARTEIAEVREKFEDGQTGSSTMAHKMNPWNFENLISMHKQILSQQLNANLNISSEHQRDLTDSANSRFYVLVPAILINMLKRADRIMGKIEVNEEQMQKNLNLTGGAIAAEPLYLLLEKYGHTEAHELSKRIAHKAMAKNVSFDTEIQLDQEAKEYWDKFTEDEKNIIKDPISNYLGLSAKKTKAIVENWK